MSIVFLLSMISVLSSLLSSEFHPLIFHLDLLPHVNERQQRKFFAINDFIRRKAFPYYTFNSFAEEDKCLRDASFVDLAVTYFRQRGYKIEKDVFLEGFSGLSRTFDLIIQKGKEQHLVWIRDWKRTVGVNMVIGMDRASEDVRIPNPIMISEKFSGHAKAYANRRGVTLLTKRQIARE